VFVCCVFHQLIQSASLAVDENTLHIVSLDDIDQNNVLPLWSHLHSTTHCNLSMSEYLIAAFPGGHHL